MKIEWLIANVTSAGSPTRAEHDICGPFWMFLADSGWFCDQGAILWSENPLLNTNHFTQGSFMKIEGLFAIEIFLGSPARAECGILG